MSENVFPNFQGLQYIGYNYFDRFLTKWSLVDIKRMQNVNSIGHIYKISLHVFFVHVWLQCTHTLS